MTWTLASATGIRLELEVTSYRQGPSLPASRLHEQACPPVDVRFQFLADDSKNTSLLFISLMSWMGIYFYN